MAVQKKTAKKADTTTTTAPKKKTATERKNAAKDAQAANAKKAKRAAKKTAEPTGGKKRAAKKTASVQVKHSNRIVIPAGLGVEASWCEAFAANHTHHETDEVITGWMQSAFPGRQSAVFSQVAGVRSKYNKGKFKQTDGVPSVPSQRYATDGSEATARGKSLLSSPGEPAEGKPAATKKAAPKKASRT